MARVIHGGLADRSGEITSMPHWPYLHLTKAAFGSRSQVPNSGLGEPLSCTV